MRSRVLDLKALRRDARVEVLDEEEMLLERELEATRPRHRADCVGGPRPCVYLSCRYHLYLEVTDAGSVKLNFPDLELHELTETCALDVADRGGHTHAAVGELMSICRERVRQIEARTLANLNESKDIIG